MSMAIRQATNPSIRDRRYKNNPKQSNEVGVKTPSPKISLLLGLEEVKTHTIVRRPLSTLSSCNDLFFHHSDVWCSPGFLNSTVNIFENNLTGFHVLHLKSVGI